MANLLVIHGPNLNLLGKREPEIYGVQTLDDINQKIKELANTLGCNVSFAQSNAEHEIVGIIQESAANGIDFIIINPAAYTHTSIAIRDAFLVTKIPFLEVHLSNVKAREEFRHHSMLEDIAVGGIFGLGAYGYELAVMAACHQLRK